MKSSEKETEKYCPHCGSNLERHLSVESVEELLDLKEDCIRKWIREGKLKAVKIGRSVRIPQSSLVEMIKPINSLKDRVDALMKTLV
ncbi:MAG: helix-turn-helix domain-containing protein [Candidatus Marinimicrobia bacterium]|nr:helix-turn-helix domain-containing protein [Candidatus Neomarinimicrobiota bacterium]